MFEILNIFHQLWFLNRDHLVINVLSTRKDATGSIVWVDFLPEFHSHLVRSALALAPHPCPVAKVKRVMFVYCLEVIGGEGPSTFFALPKKKRESRHRHSGTWSSKTPSSSSLPPVPPPVSADACTLPLNLSAPFPIIPAALVPPVAMAPGPGLSAKPKAQRKSKKPKKVHFSMPPAPPAGPVLARV